MKFRACVTLLLVGVLCSVHFTSASNSIKEDFLLTKLKIMQDNLQYIEQNLIIRNSCQNTPTEVSHSADKVNQNDGQQWDRLDKLERALKEIERTFKERDDKLHKKLLEFQASFRTMNNTLQASMKNLLSETKKISDELIKNQSKIVDTAYSSCRSAPKVSGIYDIQLAPGQFVKVYCEHAPFGGGWIVFQNRFNGKVDFFRNWTEYREGFGNLTSEFWLGLKYLHKLTSTRKHELLVVVKDYQGNQGYARYDDFSIGNEGEGFKLKIGKYTGTAGDSLDMNNGMKFSTKDRDNDNANFQCANSSHGAWWYKVCSYSNLNGLYKNVTDNWTSLHWWFLKNDRRSMAFTKMMLREVV